MHEVDITMTVNGVSRRGRVEPRITLADFLREHLHLTGTHLGCEHGVCGACTVLLNGDAVRACLVFAVQADGAHVTTIEGIADDDGSLSPVQEAFRQCHGPGNCPSQCPPACQGSPPPRRWSSSSPPPTP